MWTLVLDSFEILWLDRPLLNPKSQKFIFFFGKETEELSLVMKLLSVFLFRLLKLRPCKHTDSQIDF